MIRRKIASFMRGRYGSTGIDKLNIALMISGLVLYTVSVFFRNTAVAFTVIGLEWAIYGFFIFRLLSRNYAARIKENNRFCSFWRNVKNFFKLQKDRIKDLGKFIYRKCPECRAVLRLPSKKGVHTVRCPKCGNRFEVRKII